VSVIPLPDDEYCNIQMWSIDGMMVGKEKELFKTWDYECS
jgi:hypothetical protein